VIEHCLMRHARGFGDREERDVLVGLFERKLQSGLNDPVAGGSHALDLRDHRVRVLVVTRRPK
jgi:hypothetical protein